LKDIIINAGINARKDKTNVSGNDGWMTSLNGQSSRIQNSDVYISLLIA